MSIISKQIGWSQESNLLYEILRQFNKLSCSLCTINNNKQDNPCYVEILLNKETDALDITQFPDFFSTIDGTSQFFTAVTPIATTTDPFRVTGYRLYGGKNLRFNNLGGESDLVFISSINDPCGVITQLADGLFQDTSLTYANLPGVVSMNSSRVFKRIDHRFGLYVNMPNLEFINGNSNFLSSVLTEFRAPKLKSIIGNENFNTCNALQIIYTPMLNTIGSTDCSVNESNFSDIFNATITFTLKASLTTCNAGGPEADLSQLIVNNTVTLITT